jgi:hypothetical protein
MSATMPQMPDALLERPKRPVSAYNFFFRKERAALLRITELVDDTLSQTRNSAVAQRMSGNAPKCQHRKVPGMIGFNVASHCGKKWRELPVSEKVPYEKLFKLDQARYRREMEAWRDQRDRNVAAVLPAAMKELSLLMPELLPSHALNSNRKQTPKDHNASASRVSFFSTNDYLAYASTSQPRGKREAIGPFESIRVPEKQLAKETDFDLLLTLDLEPIQITDMTPSMINLEKEIIRLFSKGII